VTESGELKLLDCPLQNLVADSEAEPEVRAVNLLREILQGLIGRIVLPGHIINFHRELLSKNRNLETLQWSCGTLRDSSDMPSKWTWDDRAAVLASSFGVELSATYTVSIVASILLCWIAPSLLFTGLMVICFLTYGVMIWIGWYFQGGPVFKLSGVEVRTRKDMKLASKLRSAVRNAIVWLPFCLGNAASNGHSGFA
jgi:hypothetical protein